MASVTSNGSFQGSDVFHDGAETDDLVPADRDSHVEHEPEAQSDHTGDPIAQQQIEARSKALRAWAYKLKLVLLLEGTLLIIFFSYAYTLTSLTSIGMIACGLIGAFFRSTEALFCYLVLNAMNFVKNIAIWAMYNTPALVVFAIVIDMFVLAPAGAYVCYYLYKTIHSKGTIETDTPRVN